MLAVGVMEGDLDYGKDGMKADFSQNGWVTSLATSMEKYVQEPQIRLSSMALN
jgi:hypothetical protein